MTIALVTTLVQARAIVLPDTIAVDTTVLVTDGIVSALGHRGPADRRLEVDGILLPGAIDLQVNGAGGGSVQEADPAQLDRVAEQVAAGGAVAFLPTLITAPWAQLLEQVRGVVRWIKRGDHAATPLGIHLEGPFLASPGAHDSKLFVDPTTERVAALLEAAAGHLKLMTLAPSRPGAANAVAALVRAGVCVALGHDHSSAGLVECVEAGARLTTHLFNAMGPIHHREPGLAMLALDDPRLACALIVDGAHVHPAVLRNAYARLGPERTVLVTDSVAAAGMPDGTYHLAGVPVQSQAGVVTDSAGRLAGSALTMSQAAGNFLNWLPAGPWSLARALATNPARLLQIDNRGVIAPGYKAEFSVLQANGTLRSLRSG